MLRDVEGVKNFLFFVLAVLFTQATTPLLLIEITLFKKRIATTTNRG
jgi:hypothetical protein